MLTIPVHNEQAALIGFRDARARLTLYNEEMGDLSSYEMLECWASSENCIYGSSGRLSRGNWLVAHT